MCKVIVYIVSGCMLCVSVRAALGVTSRTHSLTVPSASGREGVEPCRKWVPQFLLVLTQKATLPQSFEEVKSTNNGVRVEFYVCLKDFILCICTFNFESCLCPPCPPPPRFQKPFSNSFVLMMKPTPRARCFFAVEPHPKSLRAFAVFWFDFFWDTFSLRPWSSFLILLPQFPKCRDYKCKPLHLA